MESTREIPDTAASPTLVTMTVAAMPIVTANSCSITSEMCIRDSFYFLQIINGRYTLWKPLHMKKVLEAIFGLLLIVGIMQLLSHFARCAVCLLYTSRCV